MIACGDCALNRGVFSDAYGVVGAVGEVVPVDVEIPGCPPSPDADRRGPAIRDRQMTATLTVAPPAAPNTVPTNGFGSAVAGILTSGLGALGVWARASSGCSERTRPLHIGWLLPLSGVHLELDPLGGFFMALTGAVAIPVGIYAIGYARRDHLGRVPMAALPVFVAAMLLVPAAGSVTTFLLAWELMAIASLILVLAEHTRPEVRSAGLLYAVMTQLGFVAILIGLLVLSAAGGADRFADLRAGVRRCADGCLPA